MLQDPNLKQAEEATQESAATTETAEGQEKATVAEEVKSEE